MDQCQRPPRSTSPVRSPAQLPEDLTGWTASIAIFWCSGTCDLGAGSGSGSLTATSTGSSTGSSIGSSCINFCGWCPARFGLSPRCRPGLGARCRCSFLDLAFANAVRSRSFSLCSLLMAVSRSGKSSFDASLGSAGLASTSVSSESAGWLSELKKKTAMIMIAVIRPFWSDVYCRHT